MATVNRHLIRNGELQDDAWTHVEADRDALPDGRITVPLACWLERSAELQARPGPVGVRLTAADDVEQLLDDLHSLELIVLQLDAFVDGRVYSQAYLLRTRHGYRGELRAIGDVYRDQLNFLARCGVDAFELADGEDPQAALKAFRDFSVVYQPSADGGELIFARRRATESPST